jgi:hypothetical protein
MQWPQQRKPNKSFSNSVCSQLVGRMGNKGCDNYMPSVGDNDIHLHLMMSCQMNFHRSGNKLGGDHMATEVKEIHTL